MDEELVDRIYESSFVPELWPAVLDELALIAEARGGLFFATNAKVINWTASANLREDFGTYVIDGWIMRCTRRARWFSNVHPRFLVEHDIWTDEELDTNPIYRDFLRPRGLGWSAGTAISLPTGDQLVLSLERDYRRGPVEQAGVEKLDELRPHLARSALVSARLQLSRAKNMSDALALIGLVSLVLDETGKVLAANPLIEAMTGYVQWRAHDRISLMDKGADKLLRDAIATIALEAGSGVRSFPVRDADAQATMVAHVIPIRRSARDIFVCCAAVLLLMPVTAPAAPPVELVQSLFDLTPTEARVARSLATGKTVDDIASEGGVSSNTVRTHVRGVLEKTGCRRQTDVVALLSGMSPPRG